MDKDFDWNVVYKDVELFNSLGGNLEEVTLDSIFKQLNYIAEELDETYEALNDGEFSALPPTDLECLASCEAELLDGWADCLVTVLGLGQKLKAVGFNIEEAITRVNTNNLSKFPIVQDFMDFPPDAAAFIDYNKDKTRVVYKNYEGKIIKPRNFEPVNLIDLVPCNLFVKENT